MKILISPSTAAAALGVSVRTITRMCSDGRLEGAVRVGHQWRIPSSTIEAFLPRERNGRPERDL